MKQCCKCCAELNDNVWVLYGFEGELYCKNCLIDKMVECGVISEVAKEEELGNE